MENKEPIPGPAPGAQNSEIVIETLAKPPKVDLGSFCNNWYGENDRELPKVQNEQEESRNDEELPKKKLESLEEKLERIFVEKLDTLAIHDFPKEARHTFPMPGPAGPLWSLKPTVASFKNRKTGNVRYMCFVSQKNLEDYIKTNASQNSDEEYIPVPGVFKQFSQYVKAFRRADINVVMQWATRAVFIVPKTLMGAALVVRDTWSNYSLKWALDGVWNSIKNTITGEDESSVWFHMRELVHRKSRQEFDLEIFKIVTDDGFLLELHRIFDVNETKEQRAKRPVMFLQHGMKCSSGDWMICDIAIRLQRLGYDVWLGNFRGNCYTTFEGDDRARHESFWDFSWEDIAKHDLPKMIDTVLETSGKKMLTYIGHSMGTTAFFVMANERPEYMKKIKRFIGVAPVAGMANMHGIPSWFVDVAESLLEVRSGIGIYDFYIQKSWPLYRALFPVVLRGAGHHLIDKDLLKDILKISPNHTSGKTLLHYFKNHKSQRFASWDGRTEYDLGKVSCPVELFYSPADWAAGDRDVEDMARKFPNLSTLHRVELKNFGHQDFVWSMKSAYIYKDICSRMDLDIEVDEKLARGEEFDLTEIYPQCEAPKAPAGLLSFLSPLVLLD